MMAAEEFTGPLATKLNFTKPPNGYQVPPGGFIWHLRVTLFHMTLQKVKVVVHVLSNLNAKDHILS